MIFLIIYAVLATLAAGYLFYEFYQARLEVKAIRACTTFSNTVPRRQYNVIAEFLRKRKCKFSLQSKVELISMWYELLLILPRSATDVIRGIPDSFDLDTNTLTQAEHKKAMIEALEKLAESDDLNNDDLVAACYHLYYIIFM